MKNLSHSIPSAVTMLLQGKDTQARKMVEFLCSHLRKDEVIEISPWIGTKWYVEIRDKRLKEHCKGPYAPLTMRIGFTFDLRTGKVLWNCKNGNCWCRDGWWWKRFIESYPFEANHNEICTWNHRTTEPYIHKYKFQTAKKILANWTYGIT